jgi:hypothetical protein
LGTKLKDSPAYCQVRLQITQVLSAETDALEEEIKYSRPQKALRWMHFPVIFSEKAVLASG